MVKQDIQQDVAQHGFAIVEDVVHPALIAQLTENIERELTRVTNASGKPSYALRDLFDAVPQTQALLQEPDITELVASILGPDAFAVRGLLFDKIDGANWNIPWHQDQAIAIKHKHAPDTVPGFGPASIKNGTPHTRASAQVLENMLALRIHLDDCGQDNGPLRCASASHLLGRLDPQESSAAAKRCKQQPCTVMRGGVVLMRPLCLHASSAATSPSHRRVIHIEFANCQLPDPLDWHERRALAQP